jgi:hypothetical protein
MDCAKGRLCLIAQERLDRIPPGVKFAIPSPDLGKIAVSCEP